MQEQLKSAYLAHKWVKMAIHGGLLVGTLLLFWISGGFPPHSWLFFLHILPVLPLLWRSEGLAMLPPFIGLLLLAVTLLLAWSGLLLIGVYVASSWWQERRELQRFHEEMHEAEQLATEMQQEPDDEDPDVSSKWDMLQIPPTNLNVYGTPAPPAMFQRTGVIHRAPLYSAASAPASALVQERVQATGYPEIDAVESLPTIPLPDYPANPASALVQDRVQMTDYPEIDAVESLPTIPLPNRPANLASGTQSGDLQLIASSGLDVGIKRKKKPNQDSLLALPDITSSTIQARPIGLFLVADGMGGHQNGQEASALAIQSLRDIILPALEHGPEDDVFTELLAEGVQQANLAIYRRNWEQDSNMGTTITSALVIGTTAYVANIGDSRTYLYHPGTGLTQITRDHSVVANLLAAGAITPDQIYDHPQRNVIYRNLGDEAVVKTDTFSVPLQEGDLLILCSDGLWGMMRDPDIEQIITCCLPHPPQISAMLVRAALNRGGDDNISVVVVYVGRS